MSITTLDGTRFAEMILQGANHLSKNAKYVDALNVFPVPDGDTGTNMNLSMTSGAKEVRSNPSAHIGKVGVALSKGLLMGARGNSGVILSQLFRGFSKAIETKSTITSVEFAAALQAGVDTAYKAVMKPVEGTILTVAKDAAKAAVLAAENEPSIDKLMEITLKEAEKSLKRTPELLPVLKEVGVVDSGGQGLVFVYAGFLAVLKGEQVSNAVELPSMDELVNAEHHKGVQGHINTEDIEFGYCTEFMVRFEEGKTPFNEETFRNDLSQFGDSLLVIADDELAKVHIHAEYPGEVLSYGQKYGNLINMKIENMRKQHTDIVGERQQTLPKEQETFEKSKYGIVTVTMGQGIAELFKSIGANVVIEGGQTMNPSTEDIVQAIHDANAENVIILPNNSNIVMAARQAASVVEDVHVIVIPSKTVPQGMASLLAFNPTAEPENVENTLNEALKSVKSGQITYAVRDTNIDGLDISKGDFMGILDGKIIITDRNQLDASKKLLNEMIKDEEILTIIQGQDASDEEVNQLIAFVEEQFEDIEVEVHKGEQPLYSYIFSVE
ncbi:hypothetical protein CHH83_04405 [Bacillus sp. 7586-K]|nr:hypothetical protein CHH83_04405 [Bacillus sp. 7586-K]